MLRTWFCACLRLPEEQNDASIESKRAVEELPSGLRNSESSCVGGLTSPLEQNAGPLALFQALVDASPEPIGVYDAISMNLVLCNAAGKALPGGCDNLMSLFALDPSSLVDALARVQAGTCWRGLIQLPATFLHSDLFTEAPKPHLPCSTLSLEPSLSVAQSLAPAPRDADSTAHFHLVGAFAPPSAALRQALQLVAYPSLRLHGQPPSNPLEDPLPSLSPMPSTPYPDPTMLRKPATHSSMPGCPVGTGSGGAAGGSGGTASVTGMQSTTVAAAATSAVDAIAKATRAAAAAKAAALAAVAEAAAEAAAAAVVHDRSVRGGGDGSLKPLPSLAPPSPQQQGARAHPPLPDGERTRLRACAAAVTERTKCSGGDGDGGVPPPTMTGICWEGAGGGGNGPCGSHRKAQCASQSADLVPVAPADVPISATANVAAPVAAADADVITTTDAIPGSSKALAVHQPQGTHVSTHEVATGDGGSLTRLDLTASCCTAPSLQPGGRKGASMPGKLQGSKDAPRAPQLSSLCSPFVTSQHQQLMPVHAIAAAAAPLSPTPDSVSAHQTRAQSQSQSHSQSHSQQQQPQHAAAFSCGPHRSSNSAKLLQPTQLSQQQQLLEALNTSTWGARMSGRHRRPMRRVATCTTLGEGLGSAAGVGGSETSRRASAACNSATAAAAAMAIAGRSRHGGGQEGHYEDVRAGRIMSAGAGNAGIDGLPLGSPPSDSLPISVFYGVDRPSNVDAPPLAAAAAAFFSNDENQRRRGGVGSLSLGANASSGWAAVVRASASDSPRASDGALHWVLNGHARQTPLEGGNAEVAEAPSPARHIAATMGGGGGSAAPKGGLSGPLAHDFHPGRPGTASSPHTLFPYNLIECGTAEDFQEAHPVGVGAAHTRQQGSQGNQSPSQQPQSSQLLHLARVADDATAGTYRRGVSSGFGGSETSGARRYSRWSQSDMGCSEDLVQRAGSAFSGAPAFGSGVTGCSPPLGSLGVLPRMLDLATKVSSRALRPRASASRLGPGASSSCGTNAASGVEVAGEGSGAGGGGSSFVAVMSAAVAAVMEGNGSVGSSGCASLGALQSSLVNAAAAPCSTNARTQSFSRFCQRCDTAVSGQLDTILSSRGSSSSDSDGQGGIRVLMERSAGGSPRASRTSSGEEPVLVSRVPLPTALSAVAPAARAAGSAPVDGGSGCIADALRSSLLQCPSNMEGSMNMGCFGGGGTVSGGAAVAAGDGSAVMAAALAVVNGCDATATAAANGGAPLPAVASAAPPVEMERWHEVVVSGLRHPATGAELILVTQHDVSARVWAEQQLARVMEAEHAMLEAIFPAHVLEHIAIMAAASAEAASGEHEGDSHPGSLTGRPTLQGLATAAHAAASAAGLASPHPRVCTPQTAAACVPSAGSVSCPPPPPALPLISGDTFLHLATSHVALTVLFCDIQGFTAMCNVVKPATVMAFLNDLYTRLDALLDAFGVYKVETIGDCYMVAGGLMKVDEQTGAVTVRSDDVDPQHAHRTVHFAKALLRAASAVRLPTTGEPVRLRVGIHSGPAMSGVVGTRMPRFCLFGDTVNTASRMESTGAPGAIHVSQATHDLVPGEQWEPTGGVEAKGKGLLRTFLLRPPLGDE